MTGRADDALWSDVERRERRPRTKMLAAARRHIDTSSCLEPHGPRSHQNHATWLRREEIRVSAEDEGRRRWSEAHRDGDTSAPDEDRRRGRPAKIRITGPPLDPSGCVLSARDPRPAPRLQIDPAAVVKGRPTPLVVACPEIVVSVNPVTAGHVRYEVGAGLGRARGPHGAVRRIVGPRAMRVERWMEILERSRVLVIVGISRRH